jgi:hypothetical protein
MEGSLPVLPPEEERPKCGICVFRSPQWLWVAESLGFRVAWVWSPLLSFLPNWLKEVFSTTTFFTTIHLHLLQVEVVLCDSFAPEWVTGSPQDYPRLATSKPILFRGGRKRWRSRPKVTLCYVSLKHSLLGGLTENRQRLGIWTASVLEWEEPERQKCLSSMIYLVASNTVQLRRRTPAPQVKILDPPRKLRIGGGVYHGGGLCPVDRGLHRAKFVLPSVCHQPSGWCIRRLLPVERWNVMVVPWWVAKLTYEMEEADEMGHFNKLVPGRSLEQGLCELLWGLGLMTEGGVLVLQSGKKRPHLEEEKEEGVCKQG